MRAVEAPDRELVERARHGDGEAFDGLYVRHREAVARPVYLTVGDADVAQDLAQEAFGTAWRDLGRLRDAGRFRGWVTGIALNLARRRWRRREVPVAGTASGSVEAATDDRLAVIAAIRRLPMAQRAVVVLRFYEDLAEAEIADVLGIPQGTVKSRLARARDRLAAALREEEGATDA